MKLFIIALFAVMFACGSTDETTTDNSYTPPEPSIHIIDADILEAPTFEDVSVDVQVDIGDDGQVCHHDGSCPFHRHHCD